MGVSAHGQGTEGFERSNDRLMHQENIVHRDCEIGAGIYVAIDGVYAGYIIISDEVRETSGRQSPD